MSFYGRFADYYDAVFPADEEITAFLGRHLPQQGLLLDVGCGTGSYAVALAEDDRRVVGIDVDADMVHRARLKGRGCNVEFHARSMDEVHMLESAFDGAYCIGNTLVHAESVAHVTRILDQLHRRLRPRAPVVVQIVNYDRIIRGNVRELPTLAGSGVTFRRRYTQTPNRRFVVFHTTLTTEEHGVEHAVEQETTLLALRRDELLRCLDASGFAGVRLFGSYAGEEYHPDSFLTITVASRRETHP
jgi:2-polyprenyl-3-methyl-5-hydroxy-6-metoxy-1,4-benzoquinol methylase